MQDGQDKSCGFTGSRLSRPHEVLSVENDRDGLLLNRGGFLKATGFHCLEKAFVEIKMFE